MQQENEADQADDGQLLPEADAQAVHGPLDQAGAVVSDLDFHPVGQAGSYFGKPRLDIANHLPGVCAMADDDDAADGFALAVQFGDAAPHVGPDTHIRHILQKNGQPPGVNAQGNPADVFQGLDIAQAPNHELLLGEFEGARAHIAVACLNGGADSGDRNVVGAQFFRVDGDLVLADKTADARHLGDAGHGRQFVFQVPVLDRAQFAQVVPVRL